MTAAVEETMMESMHPYLQELSDLALPAGDWAVFGSAPLLLRGWIDEVSDIDVISRGPAWEAAKRAGTIEHLDDGSVVAVIGQGVTVGRTWTYGDFSVDHLIDTAEMIAEFPCVLLEHIITYKEAADRPKDRIHLKVISERLA